MPEPQTQEVLWYKPNPRTIIPLDQFHISRSLRKSMRRYTWSINQDFAGVMRGCADRPETWINDEFLSAYQQLHREGDAHSIEVWKDGVLVGGVYGVSFAGAFFAESKFHKMRDASKVALAVLVEQMTAQRMILLEVQFMTEHLKSLGAIEIDAVIYDQWLQLALRQPIRFV